MDTPKIHTFDYLLETKSKEAQNEINKAKKNAKQAIDRDDLDEALHEINKAQKWAALRQIANNFKTYLKTTLKNHTCATCNHGTPTEHNNTLCEINNEKHSNMYFNSECKWCPKKPSS